MAEVSSTRPSEDVERGETAPLLANQSEHEEEEEVVHWKDYPRRLWSQTTSYLDALRQSRTERGKQRQVDSDGREGPDSLHIPTEQRGSSRLQGLKTDYPYLYWSLVGLLSLILTVFLLLLIALAHLYLITLRTPDGQLQSRIVDRSFSLDGPDEVKVLGVGSDGVTVSLAGRIGIDSDSALDEWLGERQTKGWYNRRERDVIEWAVGKVKGVQVDFGQVALRSPDWSVHRKIDKLHLVPDNSTDRDDKSISSLLMTSQEPTNLITFQLDPLYVPLPAIGSSARKTDVGPPANTLVNLTILLKPSGPDLLEFAKAALDAHKAVLDVNVQSVKVRGLNGKELRRESLSSFRHFSIPAFVDVSVGDTWRRLGQKLPKMDGNGTAGGDDFLNLTRYDFFEIGRDAVSSFAQRALGIKAYAEAKNPLGKLLKGHVEYSLPFGVYLPLEKGNITARGAGKGDEGKPEGVVLLAAVATEPFDIDGEDKIQLQLQGRVVPPPQPPSFGRRDQVAFSSTSNDDEVAKSDAGADALSGFLSRFLRGEPNTVYVHGGSPFTEPSTLKKGDEENDGNEEPMPGGGSVLPAWLDKLLRTMKLPISFPGSKVTDLIQNVTINDLKITPHPFEKEKLLCSGTVMGVMNMPGQLATVDVEITDLWPDILVFNGKPPSMKHGGGGDEDEAKALGGSKKKDGDGGDDTPTPEPLPDPLPDHAFGRVTPHTWAPAKTYIDPEDPKRQRKLLYSELKDVPFTVLPGRGAEFRSFSWKLVTGEGARAGIEGKARAKIWNSGLGKLELSNLPVKGVFTVGKRGDGGNGDGDGDGDDGFSR